MTGEYLKMKIRINPSIDVAGLVDALNASPTRAANLKHKIYYFLSLITDTTITAATTTYVRVN
jgi:hypothetical protein